MYKEDPLSKCMKWVHWEICGCNYNIFFVSKFFFYFENSTLINYIRKNYFTHLPVGCGLFLKFIFINLHFFTASNNVAGNLELCANFIKLNFVLSLGFALFRYFLFSRLIFPRLHQNAWTTSSGGQCGLLL